MAIIGKVLSGRTGLNVRDPAICLAHTRANCTEKKAQEAGGASEL
ncbi:hypothetical protein QQ056_01905 [Oscillatoria laete-virens NRMC-F 0139]|nr:hypothetical protein [Oscillatoria laete-virens]MDL5052323.1 hypothetical protein [Oscillatoria laete-virens NRMC-F 0139]